MAIAPPAARQLSTWWNSVTSPRRLLTTGTEPPVVRTRNHWSLRVTSTVGSARKCRRLDRKEQQQRELVGPVEVVGDDDVVGSALVRDVLAPVHLEPERQPQQGDRQQPDQPVRHVGAG